MNEAQSVAATLTAVVAVLSTLVPFVMQIWKKLGRAERRLNRFWGTLLLRGTVEGLQKKLLVEQIGPDDQQPEDGFMTVAVTPRVAEAFAPISDKLVAMAAKSPGLCDEELADAIESRFGAWLSRFICLALGVSNYACLVMALSIARGVKPAELPRGCPE